MINFIANTPSGPVAVHLSLAAPRRVVPGSKRHKWSGKPQRNQPATCLKCGCEQLWWMGDTWYRLKSSTEKLPTRPDCTGENSPK